MDYAFNPFNTSDVQYLTTFAIAGVNPQDTLGPTPWWMVVIVALFVCWCAWVSDSMLAASKPPSFWKR